MTGLNRYIEDYNPYIWPPTGTDVTPEIVSGLVDVHRKGGKILAAKNPFTYPLVNQIAVKQGTIIALHNGVWRSFVIDSEITLGSGDLDTGSSFSVGTDYYIYLVDDDANGTLVISANATFPQGRSADNSRKIGGFHFGHVRCVNERYVPIAPNGTPFDAAGKWKTNVTTGIVPNSAWDLTDPPRAPGMALVGTSWRFIYPASAEEAITFENGGGSGGHVIDGKLQSKYGQSPITGAFNIGLYNFVELAARQGLRLPTYAEWVQGAYGNPEGQDNQDQFGWTKNSEHLYTKTGCNVDGSSGLYVPAGGTKPYAISAYNLVDCVGNVSELVDELTVMPFASLGSWPDYIGMGKGRAQMPDGLGMAYYVCGGCWGEGANAGSRAVSLVYHLGVLVVHVGCRLSCDSRVV